MRPIVRQATAADLAAFYAGRPAPMTQVTVTAWCGELDGEVIAVGGFAHVNGRLIAFYDMDERARRYKVTLVRAARRIVRDMAARNKVMFAQSDPKEAGAARWIASLGFKPTEFRDIYQWRV